MGFALALVVLALLFLRPAELVPGLEDAPLYEWAIVAATAVNMRPVLGQLTGPALRRSPITVGVLGMFGMVVASHAFRGDPGAIVEWGVRFGKVVVLYLVIVAAAQTPDQVQRLAAVVGGLIGTLTALSLAHYHGLIQIDTLAEFQQREILESGELGVLPRLCGHGIFHDPNDLCVLAGVGMILAAYRLGDTGRGIGRAVWLAPLIADGYAASLTHSRGGLLAILAGLAVLFREWYGTRRTVLVALITLPALAVLAGGRQTKFDLEDREDTSQYRVRLWSDGLVALQSSPLTGIGPGMYAAMAGQVAHNSFVEAYTELGVVGGTCFLGAVAYAAWGLCRLGRVPSRRADRGLDRLRPYLLALLTCICVGMMSLSRELNPPTHVVLALLAAYLRVAGSARPGAVPPLRPALLGYGLSLGVVYLLLMSAFVRLVVRW